MFTWNWILGIVLFCGAAWADQWHTKSKISRPNITTCEQFERGARFNPYEAITSMWKIFYFWADNTELYPIVFSLPAKNRLHKFRETIESIDPELEVEWNKATLFMNPRPGTDVLFLYASTPGAYRALILREQRHNKVRPFPIPLLKFADVRMKIVGKNMGMMCCEDLTAYALARMEHVPNTEAECVEAAATLGYQGPDGRSYLYLKRKFEDEL